MIKRQHILAALIAIPVGLLAMFIISGVLMIPLSGLARPVSVGPIVVVVRVLIFGIVFFVVFREMSDKLAR